MTHLRRVLPVFVALLLMTSSVWAQVNRGTVTGIVTDPSGAVIPDVAITVTDQATGVATSVITSSAGVYTAPLLLPGTYNLTAEKDGFKRFSQAGVIVGVGETVRADVSMLVGSKTQTVQVTGQSPLLQRESAELSNVVTGQEVEELPLTSVGDQRTPASFMKLAPGVTGRGNSNGGAGSNQYMTTSVSGSIVSSTTLKLDGGDFPTASGFEGDLSAVQIPPDAIAEFKLVGSNAPAEYGRSAGGTASFEVKSGTNEIHGTAYEFVRNTDLNAQPWFVNAATPGCDANGEPATGSAAVKSCGAPYKQNEFGVTAGAPIIKDKAFIFGYYDGFRLIQGNSTGEGFVPTAAMLQGNFNEDPGLPVLYDPISQTTCGTLICGNVVTSSAINAVTAKMIPLFPAPTSSGIVNGVFSYHNYISTTSNPQSVNMWGLKGDYVINSSNRLAITYAYGKNTTPNIVGIPAPLEGGFQPSVNVTRNVRANWSTTIRPNLINQATASFNQWNNGVEPVATFGGRSDWDSYLGLQGLSPTYGTQFPQFVLNGFSYNGGGGAGFTNAHSEGIDDSLTWVKGKHTVKFGFQYLKEAESIISVQRDGGYFNFLPGQTGLLGNSDTGNGVASWLLGRANEEEASYVYANSYPRVGYYAGFAQDDFKATKKLTLNLGLRYDLFTPDFQKYYHKGWIDPSVLNTGLTPNIQGAFVAASPSDPTGVNTYYKNFSPRLGAAYSLNDKTVIRAGYGMYYGQGNANQLENSYVQGFNGNEDVTSVNGLTPATIWSQAPPFSPFTPSFGPTTLLGQGTPEHSAGSLMELQRSDGKAPYAENWNLTVERQLSGNATLTVAYVGNTSIHLPSRGLAPMDKVPLQYLQYGPQLASDGVTSMLLAPIADPTVQASAPISALPIDPATGHHSPFNGFEALYGPGVGTMGQALRQQPQYQGLHRYYEGLGVSDYDALQVKLDKRFSNGLTLLVSYAWGKTLTDGGSMFSTFSTNFGSSTPWNRGAQKTFSFQDLPNNLVISYIYDLPFGKGKRFMSQGGVVNAIVGGWKTSGILTYQSGLPQSIGTNPTAMPGGMFDQGHGSPNQVPGIPVKATWTGKFDPNKDEQINEAAFVFPSEWTYGTLTPNEGVVRSFGYVNEDMSLMKEWNIHERFTVRFNADFFNVFNRTIFGQTSNNGAYTAEPYVNNKGYGAIGGQTNYPREIQFALRLKW